MWASDQIGRINRLGRAVDLYTLEGYTMHHDFNMAQDGHLVVLATKNNTFDGRVMDFVLEVDMETGDVSELLDLRNIFPDYYDKTEKVSDTDPFFWQGGNQELDSSEHHRLHQGRRADTQFPGDIDYHQDRKCSQPAGTDLPDRRQGFLGGNALCGLRL